MVQIVLGVSFIGNYINCVIEELILNFFFFNNIVELKEKRVFLLNL